jgi:hypothetical protein
METELQAESIAQTIFARIIMDQTEQLIRTSILGGESEWQAAARAVNYIRTHAVGADLPPDVAATCWTVYLEFAAKVRAGDLHEQVRGGQVPS